MIAFNNCNHERLLKHGKDRKGNQRYKCASCGKTVTTNETRPLGDMRIEMETAVTVLKLLVEGMSIRAAERITGVHRDTICDLVLLVGNNCNPFLESKVKGVAAQFIEMTSNGALSVARRSTRS